ncbi:MAG: Thiamine precursor transporter HmpT [Candidatus Thorarchaeota archaeon AB_25]|nr:MAG: Thiamine precursor transporter HmpT [Candidatus Thorarchaeota archaeon AB_25]
MEYFRPIGKNSAINIALLAIMTALATIMTLIIQIPYPGTSGYFNFGDTMVMLGGLLLGPVGGFFAGGVGSALADVISGYTFYAPITLVVKGFEAMAVGYFSFKVKEHVRLSKWDIIGVLVGAIIMLTGYFTVQVILFELPFAIGELVTVNLAQVVIGASVALIIGPTIRSYLRTMGFEQLEPLEESIDEPGEG